VQAAYRRASKWIERGLGTVLIGLGARIVVAARI
jgi:threonine/homoserine/homoserine lactone efflux protein